MANMNIKMKAIMTSTILKPLPGSKISQYYDTVDNNFKNFYTDGSKLNLRNKMEIENLQKISGLLSRLPEKIFYFILPLIKLIIKMPFNILFKFLWQVNYFFFQRALYGKSANIFY